MFNCVLITLLSLAAEPGADLLNGLPTLQNIVSHRESSSNQDLEKNGDSKSIDPGQTLVLGELQGPGAITHIWCTVSSDDPFFWSSLVVRMYWDGAEKPSIQAPLGDFFGVGHAAFAEYASMPVCVTSRGRARSCFWRMPFRKSAKVTVSNESDKYRCDSFYYYLDWQKVESLPENTGYFHAQYRQAFPAQPGDYTILETSGRGQYVGTVYSVQQMENGWFGEGDDRFYVDGEKYPSLSGTGTEDYFGDGWGFRQFATPFFGVPLWEGYLVGDRVSAYRWHINDPVAFQKSLKVSIEHKGSVFTDQMIELTGYLERADWVSSVAFWYQAPAVGFEPMPPAPERIPPYKLIAPADLEVRGNPPMLLLKKDGGIQYLPGAPDASLEMDFTVADKGHYVLRGLMPHAVIGGTYQALMDGKPFGGPKDFCADGLDELWVNLDMHDLAAGKHTLRFEGRGMSPRQRAMAKPAYGFGISKLLLLRLEDMKGFQDGLRKAEDQKRMPHL